MVLSHSDSDDQLIRAFVTDHSETAFEMLIRRHGRMVYNVCFRILRQKQDSEDATQATFLTLANKARTLTGRESIAGWLHQVALNVARRALESRAARSAFEPKAFARDIATDSDEAPEWRVLLPMLDNVIGSLPEKYRKAVVIHYLEGQSEEETARRLKLKTGTLSSQLSRGRELLRERLERSKVPVSLSTLAVLLSKYGASQMPANLAASTAKAAILVAAGNAASEASPVALKLAHATLRAMLMKQLGTAAAVALIGVILAGTATLALKRPVQEPLPKPGETAGDAAPAQTAPAVSSESRAEFFKKLLAAPIDGSAAGAGTLVVNIENFGAKPTAKDADNATAIQAAVDDLGAKLAASPGKKGIVYIPGTAQGYGVNRTIFVDYPGIEIHGEGRQSRITMNGSTGAPVFQFGVRRVEAGNKTITPEHRPDAQKIYDASVKCPPKTYWGLRTLGDSYVSFDGTSLNYAAYTYAPDYWEKTDQFTLDFFLGAPPEGFAPHTPLLGMGTSITQPAPWFISTGDSGDTLQVSFKTSDLYPEAGCGDRRFSFSLGAEKVPHRIAIQWDLKAGAVSAFLDGRQVVTTPLANMTKADAHPFQSGLHFLRNDHIPLYIGAAGVDGSDVPKTGVDLTLYGLHFERALRYSVRGAGQEQVDLAGKPVNDAFRFFGGGGAQLGYLKFQDPPENALDPGGRNVTAITPSGSPTFGIFLNRTAHEPIADNAVRNVMIVGSSISTAAIQLGAVKNFVLERATVRAFRGVATSPLLGPSDVSMLEVSLAASDTPYYGAFQTIEAQSTQFSGLGVRLYACSDTWRFALISNPVDKASTMYQSYGGEFGGSHVLQNFCVDAEGSGLTQAVVYCENHPHHKTSLTLNGLYTGTAGAAALIILRDGGTPEQGFGPAQLSARNFQGTNQSGVPFVSDGPLWQGIWPSYGLPQKQLWNHTDRWGPPALKLATEGYNSGQPWPDIGSTTRVTSTPNALNPKGAVVTDIRAFGASPTATPAENAIAIQAAIDDLIGRIKASKLPWGGGGTLYVPPGTYTVDRSLWLDYTGITVRGEGQASHIKMAPGCKAPVFMVGTNRVEAATHGTVDDAVHRPDLFGILDDSGAPKAGMRWGIHTHKDAFISAGCSALNLGTINANGEPDYWTTTDQLTLDFCVKIPAEGGTGQIIGLGFGTYPWSVGINAAHQFIFSFRLEDTPDQVCLASFPVDTAQALQRVSIQADLKRGMISAFVNGKQITVKMGGSAPALAPGKHFKRVDDQPLMIGIDGYWHVVNLQLYGFHLYAGLRYAVGAEGSAQALLDSTVALNDKARYFTVYPKTLGLFSMTDEPTHAGRDITVQYGAEAGTGGHGTAPFLSNPTSGSAAYAFRGLKITQNTGGGPGIALGYVLDVNIDRVEITGGLQAIANYPMFGANYPIILQRAHLQGSDTAYHAYWQLLFGQDVYVEPAHGAALRMISCNAHWQNLQATVGPKAYAVYQNIGGEYGGTTTLENAKFIGQPDTNIETAEFLSSLFAYTGSTIELDGVQFCRSGTGDLFRSDGRKYKAGGPHSKQPISGRNLTVTGAYNKAFDLLNPEAFPGHSEMSVTPAE